MVDVAPVSRAVRKWSTFLSPPFYFAQANAIRPLLVGGSLKLTGSKLRQVEPKRLEHRHILDVIQFDLSFNDVFCGILIHIRVRKALQ